LGKLRDRDHFPNHVTRWYDSSNFNMVMDGKSTVVDFLAIFAEQDRYESSSQPSQVIKGPLAYPEAGKISADVI